MANEKAWTFCYTAREMWMIGSVRVGEVEVLKRGPKQCTVKGCAASDFNARVATSDLFATEAEARAAAKAYVEPRLQYLEERIAVARRELAGKAGDE